MDETLGAEYLIRWKGYKSRRQPLLWIALACIVCPVLIWVIVAKTNILDISWHIFGIEFEIVCFLVGIWFVVLIVWWSRNRGKFDLFEFPTWFALNLYIQVVLNVWLLQRHRLPDALYIRESFATYMTLSVLLIGVAVTALWISYAVVFTHLTRSGYKKKAKKREMRIGNIIWIWIISWIVSIGTVIVGIQAYLSPASSNILAWFNYFQFLFYVGQACAIALTIWHFTNPTGFSRTWFFIYIVSSLLMSLVIGTKSFALTILWIIVCKFYSDGRLPKKWIAVGFLFLFLYVPTIGLYRQSLLDINTGTGVSLTARVDALFSSVAKVGTMTTNSLIESTSDLFKSRQGGLLDATASVMAVHPREKSYVGPEMIQFLGTALIPRVLWPEKPFERPSFSNITSTYMGGIEERTHTAIGQVGDSYRAAGWVFTVIWFFFLGGFTARLYVGGPLYRNFAGTVFYLTLISTFLTYESDMFSVFLNLVEAAPLLYLIIMLIMFPLQKKM